MIQVPGSSTRTDPGCKVRGRFAPSPTGRLHFGSLVAALGSWLHARAAGGSWIVRMEDVDTVREVPGAATGIIDTLAAFGMRSDEPVMRQSERSERYAEVLQHLRELDLVYPCGCSRSELAAFGGIHPRRCVAVDDSPRASAWRVRSGDAVVAFDDAVCGRIEQDLARTVGDFVLRRADGCFAYQLAVVVDDADQGITDIVRGADLLDSTPRQIHLQRLLGLPTPRYLHLPLALDEQGRKLSKHDRARPVDAAEPMPALRAALAFLGQPVPHTPVLDDFLTEACEHFAVGRIPRASNTHVAMRKD